MTRQDTQELLGVETVLFLDLYGNYMGVHFVIVKIFMYL